MSSEQGRMPKVGALLRDTKQGRVGEFMAVQGGRYLLRPQGGGCEWEVGPDQTEPLTAEEELSARVAEANRRSQLNGGVK